MKLLRRVLLVALFGVLVYGAFVVVTGYTEVAGSLVRFSWLAFAAALGLASANYLLRFLRWQYYLRVLQVHGVGVLDSFLIFLSGFVLTVTPGKLGEVFKSLVMSQTHGVPVERTAPIVVAERLSDVLGIVVLILLGSTSFQGGLPWAIAGAVLVAVALGFILWQHPVLWLLDRLARSRLAKLVPRLSAAYRALRALSSLRQLILPTLLSMLAWAVESLALFVLLRGFDVAGFDAVNFDEWTQPLRASFFYATATLAGALTPLPGGLGIVEALLQQQMVLLGDVSQSVATASMMLVRLATLWWAVGVGFVALAWLKLRFPRLLRENQG